MFETHLQRQIASAYVTRVRPALATLRAGMAPPSLGAPPHRGGDDWVLLVGGARAAATPRARPSGLGTPPETGRAGQRERP